MVKNVFKVWTIVLGIIVVLLLFTAQNNKPQEIYDFDGVEISKEDLTNYLDVFEDNSFRLCDINLNKCVVLQKGE